MAGRTSCSDVSDVGLCDPSLPVLLQSCKGGLSDAA